MSENPRLAYRPDIDGLRGLSVIAVVLFHASVPGFGGGFVGVDVFFVISGYLITTIILAEREHGSFTLLRFYDRRARRLVPALFLMAAVTTAVTSFLLLPSEYISFGKLLTAVAIFSGNIQLWMTEGYFHREARYNPLLHAWSLGVEEQFYLLFPVMLLLVLKLSNRSVLIGFLIAGSTISLGLAEELARRPSSAAFFLLPPRAYELVMGALLAATASPQLSAKWTQIVSVLGLSLIICSIWWLDETSVFPGISAVPAVAGTALIIAAGTQHQGFVTRLLSTRPMVAAGLISYSLYLYHWPLLVFANLYLARSRTAFETAGLLLLAAIFAAASWKYAEQPLKRWGNTPRNSWLVLGAAAIALLLIAAAGIAIVKANGFPQRVPAAAISVDRDAQQPNPQSERCLILGPPYPSDADCTHSATYGKIGRIVVWGDSHANHFFPSVVEAVGGRYDVQQLSLGSCPPLANARFSAYGDTTFASACPAFNRHVLRRLLTSKDIRLVILSFRMDAWVPSTAVSEVYRARRLLSSSGMLLDPRQARAEYELRLNDTIRILRGRDIPVLIIRTIPTFASDPADCVRRATLLRRKPTKCSFAQSTHPDQQVGINAILLRLVQRNAGVRLYNPAVELCFRKVCSPLSGGRLLYADGHHLSKAGATFFAPKLRQPIEQALAVSSCLPSTGRKECGIDAGCQLHPFARQAAAHTRSRPRHSLNKPVSECGSPAGA